MKIQNELMFLQSLLELDDYDIVFDRDRIKFPDAVTYQNMKKIVVHGNPTSLARYALYEILLHEKVHILRYIEGDPDWDKHDDKFWIMYGRLRKEYEDFVGVIRQ